MSSLNATDQLIKSYSDKVYKYTTTVVHRGSVLAFALDENRRIFYAVLDLNTHDPQKGALDSKYWPEDPKELRFPNEIEQVGYSLIGSTHMAPVDKNGLEAKPDGPRLRPEEVDGFLSTTARLTDDAPFQVFSDGSHIFVFRQSLPPAHKDMLYKLKNGCASGDKSGHPESDYVQDGADKVPIVSNTMLADRFVLSSSQLRPTLQARYKRSRHKTKPASAKDSLGVKDMEGCPFFEPTQELAFVKNLQLGRFSVLQLPTQVADVKRWQIFSHSSKTDRIHSFNLEVGSDGLFNPAGTQLYTSPDKKYRTSVLEREPGTCPFTEQPLIPVATKGGHAESCVSLDGNVFGSTKIEPWDTKEFTIEMWLKPARTNQQAYSGIFSSAPGSTTNAFQIDMDGSGNYRFNHSGAMKNIGSATTDWQFLSVSYNGSKLQAILDQEIVNLGTNVNITAAFRDFIIGTNRAKNRGFEGMIDEIRIWDYARSETDIIMSQCVRLIGDNLGLRAYYRMDEGSGNLLHDESGNNNEITITGNVKWFASDAPIGDHPSMRHSSFTLSAAEHLSEEEKANAAAASVETVSEAKPPVKKTIMKIASSVTNVALGKPCEASSYYWSCKKEQLGRAVNGKKGKGDLYSVTHSDESDLNPWFRIDLQKEYEVHSFKVYGRHECMSRLNKFKIEVLDSNMQVVGHVSYNSTFTKSGAELKLQTPLMGTYVRLSKSNSKVISLEEFEVYAAEITEVEVTEEAAEEEESILKVPTVIDFAGPKSLTSGISTQLYYQQENTTCGYNGEKKPMKKNARVMLCAPTITPGKPDSAALAAMEFAISREGRLVQVPDSLVLPVVAQPQGSHDAALVKNLEGALSATNDKIAQLTCERNNIAANKALAKGNEEKIKKLENDNTELNKKPITGYSGHPYMGFYPIYGEVSAENKKKIEENKKTIESLKTQIAQAEKDADSQMRAIESEIIALEQEIEEKKNELSAGSGGTKGNITLPMKTTHTDASGLTLNAGLLSFANSTGAAPMLESATGKLTAYFRDTDGRLNSGCLDSKVSRTKFELQTDDGAPVFVFARAAGSNLKNATVSVTPGSTAETCTLTISDPELELTEEWINLPRNADEFSSIVNGMTSLPENATAKIEPATYSLAKGSTQVMVMAEDSGNTLSFGEASKMAVGADASWVADAPGQAYRFNGQSHMVSCTSDLSRFERRSKLTVEAWVNPSVGSSSRTSMMHYNGQESAYFLGLEDSKSKSSFSFDGEDLVTYPLPKLFVNDKSFTIECWVRFHDMESGKTVFHASKDEENFMMLYLNNQMTNKLQLTTKYGGVTSTRVTNFLPIVSNWYHISCVWDASSTTSRMYVNGEEQVISLDSSDAGVSQSGFAIGAKVDNTNGIKCDLDEVRAYNYGKKKASVRAGIYRRAFSDETGLVAHYTFLSGEPVDQSRFGHHGFITGTPQKSDAPSSLRQYHLVAGVSSGEGANHAGQRILRSSVTMDANHWNHVACMFAQSYGISLNGGDNYIDCGRSSELNITGDFTVEVFFQVDQIGRTQGIMSKGSLGMENQSTPYQLVLERDGKLRFTFEDSNGRRHDYRSGQGLSAGEFHRIAVTRRKGMTKSEKKGKKSIEYFDADGNKESREIDMIESVDMIEWVDITFYIDGKAVGVSRYNGQAPAGHKGELEIGRVVDGSRYSHLQGTISEVRLWGIARTEKEISKTIEGNEMGLTAWWKFEEKDGNIAIDTKSDNHAKLNGGMRVKTPDPKSSKFVLCINGVPVESEAVDETESWYQEGFGDQQFSLGAFKSNGTNTRHFNGALEEIRIWDCNRTQEEVQDNLFSRLKGDLENIIAYYAFDNKSTEVESTTLYDQGLRRCDIELPTDSKMKPSIVLSTAPISEDASIVRSALVGVDTAFQIEVDASPSVQEYTDLQRDSEGRMRGVMKRCYSYLRNGKWYLYTGYKVGDLVAEWIGQAQFDPQVVGYIEGCPPLPSENLTDGAMSSTYENYAFIATLSNLELVESDSVSYNVSSSKEGGINGSFEAAIQTDLGDDTLLITAPLGMGIAKQLVEAEFEAGVSANFEGAAGWASEQSFGTSINKSRSLSCGLGGTWEPTNPEQQLNTVVGRRLVPGNMGFALVQSETADIFAMRLAHNNALVSFKMQPNPEIPKDWNLIPFPINNRYVKQGTLDGRVGYNEQGSIVLDPDYADCPCYGEHSYYKPREAYALKRKIQRQEAQLTSYYEDMSVDAGSQAEKVIGQAGKMAGQVLASAGADPDVTNALSSVDSKNPGDRGLPKKFAKRDLCNTYVWTADGGFFAETTETTDVRTESTSGEFSFNGSVGGNLSADVSVFSLGFSLEFNAAIGGGLSSTSAKDKESEKSFSLDVMVDPPGDLQIYQTKEHGTGLERLYDGDGNGINAAGKVDAYRFMSFYLDGDKDNFEDLFEKVIDPTWLRESDHPNAMALRQANQSGRKPACWRIMHRVTFISRLLPEFSDPTSAPDSLEKAMKCMNIDSNWQLVKKLEPLVRNKTGDEKAFRKGVRDSISKYMPELKPHTKEITAYLMQYFGME